MVRKSINMKVSPEQEVKRKFKCETKFRCPEGCNAWIVRARALSVHYASVHKEDRGFYCITCEVFFSRYVDFGKTFGIPPWDSYVGI